jgi:drug/metabolite transporter (DMT)-like permease
MIGEIASFTNALANAFTNTLGGKSTQQSSWRNTLRGSTTIAFALICVVIAFDLSSLTLRVVLIGLLAGFTGGLGLPFIYQAFAVGSVSFVGPVVALVQSFNLILFALFVKNEELSTLFPIAAFLGAIGLYLCSRQGGSNQKTTLYVFFLTAAAAALFSGFSFIITLIETSEILPALFGARIGVLLVSIIFSPKSDKKVFTKPVGWRKYALLSGTCEIIANLLFMIAINNLELSKVGIFMASAPALSVLIAIKLLHQKPSLVNWAGIAATSAALALIAVG